LLGSTSPPPPSRCARRSRGRRPCFSKKTWGDNSGIYCGIIIYRLKIFNNYRLMMVDVLFLSLDNNFYQHHNGSYLHHTKHGMMNGQWSNPDAGLTIKLQK
jgi:hypothetical protein